MKNIEISLELPLASRIDVYDGGKANLDFVVYQNDYVINVVRKAEELPGFLIRHCLFAKKFYADELSLVASATEICQKQIQIATIYHKRLVIHSEVKQRILCAVLTEGLDPEELTSHELLWKLICFGEMVSWNLAELCDRAGLTEEYLDAKHNMTKLMLAATDMLGLDSHP